MTEDNFQAGDHLGLIWPEKLIAELAETRKTSHWAVPLAIINFALAGLLALLVGPLQLVLLIVTQNYTFVNDTFAPAILRIALLVMGVIAIAVVVDLVQIWRERPQKSLMATVFNLGAILIGAVIWLGGELAHLQANQLTLLFILIAAAALAFAKLTAKVAFAPEFSHRTLNIALISALALAIIETGATSVFLLSQTGRVEEDQIALEALGAAQAAARLDGVATDLSDLVFVLCDGTYDPIYLATGSASTATGAVDNSGLFECRDTHHVYSVTGPTERTANSLTGRAFYFGTTYDPTVSTFFPSASGAKYLYRNLSALAKTTASAKDLPPSELVLLVPAASEEILVNTYLEPLLDFLNVRPTDTDLTLSIFYSSELNTVLSTRDFILIAAVNTIAMLDYLPGGSNYTSYLNGALGAYIYTPDTTLVALSELGLSPSLYSSQTRDALNSRRHISLLLDKNHEYTADELRELLYASFVDPAA